MDKLSEIINRFSISAGVFYSGNICGVSSFHISDKPEGHLHLLKRGRLKVTDNLGYTWHLAEPAVIYLPKPTEHKINASEQDGAEIVCATIDYGTSARNPLTNSVPGVLVTNISDAPALGMIVNMLFDEAFGNRIGKQAMTDRLTELCLFALLRHVIEQGFVREGMLAGLNHPQLEKAISAIHRNPERSWTLEELAGLSAMSRSRFANVFKQLMGQPPGDYLMEWRVGVAQNLLKKGKPVGWVANQVGYESTSALSRAFRKKAGCSPRIWLQQFERQIHCNLPD